MREGECLMKKFAVVCFVLLFMSTLCVTEVSALSIDITVFDGFAGTPGTSMEEDNTVDFASQTGQEWDLEAFMLDADLHTLTLVSGYDLVNGADNIRPGDIFVDVDATDIDGAYGYEYAIDYSINLDIGTGTYSVYAITSASDLLPISGSYSPEHDGANPFEFNTAAYNPIYTGTATYGDGSNYGFADWQNEDGSAGTDHYALTLEGINNIMLPTGAQLNLEEIGTGFHYTMECGNDVLRGRVPEPASLVFLCASLLGLVAVRRKKQ